MMKNSDLQPTPKSVTRIDVNSAEDMHAAVMKNIDDASVDNHIAV